jgi:hypothetical protein
LLQKLTWIVLAAVVAFLVWFGWLSDRVGDRAANDDAPSTTHRRGLSDQRLSVVGLRPRASESAVLQTLGRPDVASSPKYDASLGDSVSNWTYDGVLVEMVGHEVLKIHCSATRCATADGVAVGDPRSHVLGAYGSPRSVETVNDLESLRYAGSIAECSLNFIIRGELVAAIDLVCDGS